MTNQKGFSIIEFIVTMSLLLILFAAAFSIFIPVARRSKAESGNVQTQIEGVIGLEMLRKDVVHAGVGLPWRLNGADYAEATELGRDAFNDAHAAGADDPPRAIITQNNITTSGFGLNDSDYLVVKSQMVASITNDGTNYVDNPSAEKWTYVNPDGSVRNWSSTSDDMVATDRVIVVQPTTGTDEMVLAVDTSASNKFWTNYACCNPNTFPANFRPTGNAASYVFGIDSAVDPRMPFNRADYYLSSQNVPARCAAGTGVLVKRVLRQNNGQVGNELPLLDCVVTFQVVVGMDNTFGDNLPQKNCLTNDTSTVPVSNLPGFSSSFFPADEIRELYKEVRIYVLAQEGTFDMDYTFNNHTSGTSILVGEDDPNDCDAPGGGTSQSCDCTGSDGTLGTMFDMSTLPTRNGGLDNYTKYRWRVYKMVIKPEAIVTIQ